jgi:hypothetical protein
MTRQPTSQDRAAAAVADILRRAAAAWHSRIHCLCSGWPHSSFCPRSRYARRLNAEQRELDVLEATLGPVIRSPATGSPSGATYTPDTPWIPQDTTPQPVPELDADGRPWQVTGDGRHVGTCHGETYCLEWLPGDPAAREVVTITDPDTGDVVARVEVLEPGEVLPARCTACGGRRGPISSCPRCFGTGDEPS